MIRLARPEDFDALADLYCCAVQQTAIALYSPEQIEAWSSFTKHREKFHPFIFNGDTFLKEINGEIVGFCGLEADGHVISLYVHPRFNRQGHGSALLRYVLQQGEARGMRRFYAEASYLSKSVFERCGFQVAGMETVDYFGVVFERFQMERWLGEPRQ